jgi:hypothetical protein
LGHPLGRTGLGHDLGLGFVDGLGAQPSAMVRDLEGDLVRDLVRH